MNARKMIAGSAMIGTALTMAPTAQAHTSYNGPTTRVAYDYRNAGKVLRGMACVYVPTWSMTRANVTEHKRIVRRTIGYATHYIGQDAKGNTYLAPNRAKPRKGDTVTMTCRYAPTSRYVKAQAYKAQDVPRYGLEDTELAKGYRCGKVVKRPTFYVAYTADGEGWAYPSKSLATSEAKLAHGYVKGCTF